MSNICPMKKIILLLLIVGNTCIYARQSTSAPNAGHWQTGITMGDFLLSTYLTVTRKGDQVIITSPRNADRRLFGFSKSALARLMGKIPKKGRFLVIDAKQMNDSVIGPARMPIKGHVEFRGTISEKDNSLNGRFIKDGEVIGALKGEKTTGRKNDYKSFYPIITDLTQKNIYSKQVLQSEEWEHFEKKLKNLTDNATDDIELFLGFSIYSAKLPFSHFYLLPQTGEQSDISGVSPTEHNVIFEEKTPTIAYMNVKNFSSTQKEITEIFPRIIEKGYPNLIIDLRNNGGGGIEAATELAKYILKDSVFIGYFFTNRFSGNADDQAALNGLPLTHATTTDALIEELKTSPGVRFGAPKPTGQIYKGKIYVLTNKNTASTCEPVVYVLQQKKLATIIGEATAGAMLSSAYFTVQGRYKLVLPIADFLTSDFVRLEKKGVKPDIETTSDVALERAIAEIQK